MEDALGPLPAGCLGRILLLDPAAADVFALATRDVQNWPTEWAILFVDMLAPRSSRMNARSWPVSSLENVQVVPFLSASHTRALGWLLEWLAEAASSLHIDQAPKDQFRNEPKVQMPVILNAAEKRHRLVYGPWVSESGLRRLARAGWLTHFSVGLLPARFYPVNETLWSLGWPFAGHALLVRGQQYDFTEAIIQALESLGYEWERIRALGPCSEQLAERLAAAATTKNTTATQTAPEMASRDRFGLSSTVGSVERHSHVLAARSEQDQEPTLLTDMKTATEAETEAETGTDTHRSRSGLWSTESNSGTASAEHRPVETTEEPCLFQEPWQRLGNDHCVWPRDPDTPADNPGVVLLPQEPEAMSTASATTRRRPRARLVLLDRWLDPITPLVTPVTIHGLEYERGHAPCWQRWNWTEPRPAEEVQSWLLEQERKTSACSILQMESTGKRLSEAEQAKLHQRIQTICQEPFFKATSDIGAWAQALKRFSDARPDPNAADMAQVADYVRALQRHQAEQRLVSELLLRAQQLSADTFDHVYFRELLALERELLRGEAERRIGTETFAKRLEQILAAVVVAPSGSWLGDRSLFWRLIVLHGFCTGSDDFLERHTSLFHIAACCYGIDRLRSDWRALVESDLVAQITRKIRGTRHGVGLLAPANFDWPLARDALQLNHVDSNVTDAYAGYLPLSAALAVLACDGKRSPWQFPTSPLKHASPGDDNNTENEQRQVWTSSAGELNRSLLILRQTPNLLRPIQPRHWHHGPFRELCQRALGCHKGPMTRAISMPHSEETLSLTPVGKRVTATPEWILVIGGCSPVEAECLASAVAQSRGASCPVQVLTTGVHSSREWLLLTLHGDDSTLWDRQSVS